MNDHEKKGKQTKVEDDPIGNSQPLNRFTNWDKFIKLTINILDAPVTYVHDNVVRPRQTFYKWYHQRFRRVPTIDNCETDDTVCFTEANFQYKRDRMVDAEIIQILRKRFEDCVLYETPDHLEKCKDVLQQYEDASTNWFIKYGDLGGYHNVYMYIGMRLELFSALMAYMVVFSLPVIHIFVMWKLWGKYEFPVDKASCTCECWDTIFKGKVSKYKTFYFNATMDMMKIWALALTAILVGYECFRHIVRMATGGAIRGSMLLLFTTSLYPNYYSLWVYVNYINDRFYEQWNHQLYFTTTELLSTAIVLNLMNAHRPIKPYQMFIILGISSAHIVTSGIDNAFANIVLAKGSLHGVLRDIAFLIADLSQLIVSSAYLARRKCFTFRDKRTRRVDKLLAAQILITLLFVLFSLLLLFAP